VSDTPCEVPLPEMLRSIPKDYRSCIPFQWSEDGRETGHHMIPVGLQVHQAADRIETLERELAAAQEKMAEMQDDAQAMALVKKFKLSLNPPSKEGGWWNVTEVWGKTPPNETGHDPDLNRAICACVAMMMKEKGNGPSN
jgi:hypothetical protein